MIQTELREKLNGNRITLKKNELEQAETIFDYVNLDRTRLGKFLPWVEFTNTLQDEIDYIKHTHEKWEEKSLFDFGIFDNKSNTYMGNIGVHTIDWFNSSCEIGYWILGKFEGQGFVSDALKTLEKHLFEIGFNRIEIRCSDLNERSANIPKSNAFVFEGELRQNTIQMGSYRNTKVFSKLASDFSRNS